MASLNPAGGLAAINTELETFLERIRRQAHTPLQSWFTVREAKELGVLLHRGEALVHAPAAAAAERERYGGNLVRVLYAFRSIQVQLEQFCHLVSQQRQHAAQVNAWVDLQRRLGV